MRVGIIGATGLVGQRFVSLLANHPWFDIAYLASSPERSGRKYGDTVHWVIEGEIPENVRDITLAEMRIEDIYRADVDLVFSALPAKIAAEIEPKIVKEGMTVISNSSPYRMEPDIPLINPEVNATHLKLLYLQEERGWRGRLVKVPNCSTAILTLPLKAIASKACIKKIYAVTLQAVSGAGKEGVPALTIIDNVVPHIPNEEEKIQKETKKILGEIGNGNINPAPFTVKASINRVPVLDGHLIHIFLETCEEVETEELIQALHDFPNNEIKGVNLPTAPKRPIIVRYEPDRPQPRLDRLAGNGMSVTVGRIYAENKTIRLVALGHNTIRGAAGTGILIAETMYRKGIS